MQRQPPRFVPTLTEVIDVAVAEPAPVAVAAPLPDPIAALLPEVTSVAEAAVALPAAAVEALPQCQGTAEGVAQHMSLMPEPPPPPVQGMAPVQETVPDPDGSPTPPDMESLVQAAVQAQLPWVMAQLEPVVEDALRMAVLRGLQALAAQPLGPKA